MSPEVLYLEDCRWPGMGWRTGAALHGNGALAIAAGPEMSMGWKVGQG
jgi:hypothetical protein